MKFWQNNSALHPKASPCNQSEKDMSFDVVIKRSGRACFALHLMRCIVALGTLTAISTASIQTPAAVSENEMATISVQGGAQVNGENAISGQTLFEASSIQTSTHSESVIDFKNLVRFRLGSKTAVTFDASAVRVSAVMTTGQLRSLVPRDVTLHLTTNDVAIRIAGDQTTVFDVEATECEGTTIWVREGQLNAKGPRGERILNAGDALTTASSPMPASGIKKRIGIFILGGMAAALLLAAMIGPQPEQQLTAPGGCVDLLSGESNCR